MKVFSRAILLLVTLVVPMIHPSIGLAQEPFGSEIRTGAILPLGAQATIQKDFQRKI